MITVTVTSLMNVLGRQRPTRRGTMHPRPAPVGLDRVAKARDCIGKISIREERDPPPGSSENASWQRDNEPLASWMFRYV